MLTSSKTSENSHSLFEVCKQMGSTLELNSLLDMILDLIMAELNAQRGSVLLIDKNNDQLKMLASRGMPKDVVEKGYIPRKRSVAEWVIENKEPLIINNMEDEQRFKSIVEGAGMLSSMCVPLQAKGVIIGTLNISRINSPEEFTHKDLETLAILASQAAISIDNARLYEENIRATRLATIGQTVAGISHCVKNILTGIQGGLALVELGSENDDWHMTKEGQLMLRRNIERISLLVHDMLDYAKERKPTRSPASVNQLFDDVYNTIKYYTEKHDIKVSINVEENVGAIEIDQNQIYRCLVNLATNAIDAIPDGGSLRFEASRLDAGHDDYERCKIEGFSEIVALKVSDDGRGIAPEHIEEIFAPFYSTKGTKGTGIGLAVTKKIVEEHEGKIIVDSILNEGTNFTIVLPSPNKDEANEV